MKPRKDNPSYGGSPKPYTQTQAGDISFRCLADAVSSKCTRKLFGHVGQILTGANHVVAAACPWMPLVSARTRTHCHACRHGHQLSELSAKKSSCICQVLRKDVSGCVCQAHGQAAVQVSLWPKPASLRWVMHGLDLAEVPGSVALHHAGPGVQHCAMHGHRHFLRPAAQPSIEKSSSSLTVPAWLFWLRTDTEASVAIGEQAGLFTKDRLR